MRSDFVDLTGKVFGRLKVIKYFGKIYDGRTAWECLCECGKTKNIIGQSLKSGNTQSCGCLIVDSATIHGFSQTMIYKLWWGMIQRCYYPSSMGYKYYGGKGVTVCDSWHRFENFLADMGMPKEKESIDRFPDTEGNYDPGNTRWATDSEQALNRKPKKNKTSKHRGVRKTQNGRWTSMIAINGKMNYLGTFDLEKEAATVYLKKYFDIHKKWPPEYFQTPLCYITPLHRAIP